MIHESVQYSESDTFKGILLNAFRYTTSSFFTCFGLLVLKSIGISNESSSESSEFISLFPLEFITPFLTWLGTVETFEPKYMKLLVEYVTIPTR